MPLPSSGSAALSKVASLRKSSVDQRLLGSDNTRRMPFPLRRFPEALDDPPAQLGENLGHEGDVNLRVLRG